MLRIAVTGGIACGKSMLGVFMAEHGVPVCEADELARQAVEPGQPAYDEVVREFGRGILAADGRIDRRQLGSIVFEDEGRMQVLNGIVHPRVRAACEGWIREQSGGEPVAAVIIPLLYEAGMSGVWDAEVCVCASESVQLERLALRGFSEREALQRIRAQWPVQVKCERADYVIVNNGTETRFRQQAHRVLASILER